MNQKIIRICEQKLIYLNYSPRTITLYLNYIQKFINSIGDKQIVHLNSKDFQSYLDNYSFTTMLESGLDIRIIQNSLDTNRLRLQKFIRTFQIKY